MSCQRARLPTVLPRHSILAAVLLGASFAPLPAHGGQYRGPWPFPTNPNPARTSIPTTTIGAPTPGRMPGPTTGARPAVADDTSWQVWWEFNKDPFLQLKQAVRSGPQSGSDDYFLGANKSVVARDALAPSDIDRRDRIVPALAAALASERHRDNVTACLVGLAKVGLDLPPDLELTKLFAVRLARDDQEVRETAALALGIDGRAAGLPALLALVRDDGEGRRLLGNEAVPERTRAFAAYGLGLLAHGSGDAAVKQLVHDALAPLLLDQKSTSRDLRVAAMQGLGLLAPDLSRAADKRLLWQTLGELWQFYDADLGRGSELLQAHVPTAVGRLLGRGDGPDHRAAKTRLLAEIGGKSKRHVTVQQSAAQALGMLALPPEQAEDDAAISQQLVRYYQDGPDQQARRFCVIALGRIGGERSRETLLKLYATANKSTEKPWVALALGLCAHASKERGEIDLVVAKLLLDDLGHTANNDTQAAMAVALGLCGWRDAGERVQELLLKNERAETLAGYLCVALALLDYREATPTLTDIVVRSVRRPFLLLQAAVALGRLGDKDAAVLLQKLMRDNDSAAALAALAQALGNIGDRRSIEPLRQMLVDQDLTRLARSFVAAALGSVGDKAALPWNSWLAVDVNYAAAVDTLTDGNSGVLDIL